MNNGETWSLWGDIISSCMLCTRMSLLVSDIRHPALSVASFGFVFKSLILTLILKLCNQGRNLRGVWGGDSPPPPTPDFVGHRGSLPGKITVCLRQCKALRETRCRSMSVNLSAVRKFFRGYYVPPQDILHNGRAVYPFTPPPQPKGASFAPVCNCVTSKRKFLRV